MTHFERYRGRYMMLVFRTPETPKNMGEVEPEYFGDLEADFMTLKACALCMHGYGVEFFEYNSGQYRLIQRPPQQKRVCPNPFYRVENE